MNSSFAKLGGRWKARGIAAALIVATLFGSSGSVGAREPSTPDPADTYNFKHIGSSTVTGTATYGGVSVTFTFTVTSCGPSGNDCKRTANGSFEPKG